MKVAVLALSGGMDSTSLLLHLLREGFSVFCIQFDYGQKHRIEIERANKNIELLQSKGFPVNSSLINLEFMSNFKSALTSSDIQVPEGHYEQENMKLTVVPNRNAIFSSIIYGYALSVLSEYKCDTVSISLGIHSGDHAIYPDCRPEFRDKLQEAFQVGNWDGQYISYYTPYLYGDKTSILKDALKSCKELDLDFDEVLRNTNTSYNPDSNGKSSGKSGADIERIEAFINIGRQDPIEYSSTWEEVKEHTLKVLNEKSTNII